MTDHPPPPVPNPHLAELAPRLAALSWIVSQDEALQEALRPELPAVPACAPGVRFVVMAVDVDGAVYTGRLTDDWTPELERSFRGACAAIGRVGFPAGPLRELA